MQNFKVKHDKNSGAILFEGNFKAEDRVAVCVSVSFKPVGIILKILYWLGLEYPGPVVFEAESDFVRQSPSSTRDLKSKYVVEKATFVAHKGSNTVRAVINPEDFHNKWEIAADITALYN